MTSKEVSEIDRKDELSGRIAVLGYLAGVAGETQGAEVWRAVFAEMRVNCQKRLDQLSKEEA